MPLELRELDEISSSEWNEIVGRFEEATIFHTMEWLRILADLFGATLRPFGILEEDKIVGIFPAFSIHKVFFNILASPLTGWATPRIGPLCQEDRIGDFLLALEAILDDEKVNYSEITFIGNLKEGTLQQNGFSTEERRTYILDLEPDLDVMWAKLEGKCRNMVRKAEKNKLQVVAVESEGYFDEYYRMAEDVYEKSNRPPAIPREFFRRVWESFHGKGQMRVLSAEHQGKSVAGAVFLTYRDSVYYWDGVSYRQYNTLAPNNLIQWELIKWAAQSGYKTYDMLGADMPGVARFKASFGPKLASYTYAYRNLSFLSALGRTSFKKFMPLVRRLKRRISK